jgi:hypothetical protein
MKQTTHVWGDEIVRRCTICQEEFRGQGNNAEPVNDGRCCDPCNHTTVFTARVNVMNGIMKHVEEGTINSDLTVANRPHITGIGHEFFANVQMKDGLIAKVK